jgi:inner membrane protein
VAVGCLACATVYIGLMLGGSRLAVWQVVDWLSARDDTPVEIMAGPLPANPFVRDVVVVDDEHYHFLEVDWLRENPVQIASPAIERGPSSDDPVVKAAIAAPQVQGLMRWIRFPAYFVETLPDGYRVTIRDVRYARRMGPGLGDAVVELDEELRVTSPQ